MRVGAADRLKLGLGLGLGLGRHLSAPRWSLTTNLGTKSFASQRYDAEPTREPSAAWGATVRGTHGTAEAGTRTQHVQCAGPWGRAALRLRYVPNAGGWYA